MAEKERPGVMVYFNLRPSLKRLSNDEKGLLFEAMMDYAKGRRPNGQRPLRGTYEFSRTYSAS